MTFSRSARGAVLAVVAMVTTGVMPGALMAQAAARSADPLPTVTMPDFSALVERYGPAVVNVEVVERPQAAGRGGPDADDPLNDFFRRFGIPNQGGGQPRTGAAGSRRRCGAAWERSPCGRGGRSAASPARWQST